HLHILYLPIRRSSDLTVLRMTDDIRPNLICPSPPLKESYTRRLSRGSLPYHKSRALTTTENRRSGTSFSRCPFFLPHKITSHSMICGVISLRGCIVIRKSNSFLRSEEHTSELQ